ncbi:MAG: Fe3+-siderophores ABC transporter protein [Bdellovibrionaceae bacterium]|nr:Fe3+-siderophores ABC transporter protein [Pseudobdellovibrionaceae bacterium]
MRIVSLVPSWTETLIEAGEIVVGCTRFCIHPKSKVESLVRVGGTKNPNWEKIGELNPDLVIFDQEENNKEDFDNCPYPKWASSIHDLNACGKSLISLGKFLNNDRLEGWGKEYLNFSQRERLEYSENTLALLRWVNPPPTPSFAPKRVHYLIWKDPYMEVRSSTYIGSVLHTLGLKVPDSKGGVLYPEVNEEDIFKEDHLILLSSEPYPFAKHVSQFKGKSGAIGLVDGEKMSWFGVRGLNFLKQVFESLQT